MGRKCPRKFPAIIRLGDMEDLYTLGHDSTSLSNPPQTFDAATQTNRAKSLPELHFSSNSSFFAFVTITACISSAHMLLFIMLFAHALQQRHATCSHWLVSFICSTYYDYGHFMGRKRSAARLSEVTTVKLSSGRQTKICGIPGPALSSASLCLYVHLLG